MNDPHPCFSGRTFVPLAAFFSAALIPTVRAQTYTWIAPSSVAWATTANWSPNIDPVSGDTITFGVTTNLSTNGANRAVTAIDSGTANGSIIGDKATARTDTLTVGTINEDTSDSLQIGDYESGYNVALSVTTINVSSSNLNLGGSGSTTGRELYELNGVSNVNMSGGTLNLNVLSSYSLGVVSATGTSTIVLIANSDTVIGPVGTAGSEGAIGTAGQTATVSGLEGTGTLTIAAASGTEGGVAALNLTESGATNYASGAVLSDGSATSGVNQLVVAVSLSGGATQTLTGSSTYSGGTTVSGGTLYVSNITAPVGSGTGVGPVTVASGATLAGTDNGRVGVVRDLDVTVASGATLAGTGTIAPNASSNVTINGILQPGDLGQTASGPFTPGLLTFDFTTGSQLIFGSGSALDLALGAVSSSVNFATAGTWLSGTGNWTLNLTNGGGSVVGTAYPVFVNDTDSPASFAPAAVTYTTGGNLYTLASTAYELQTSGSNYTITLPGAVITSSPPASTNLVVGGTASFTVAASGTGTLTYQWELNGTALANGGTISGVTTATLNLSNLQLSEAGQYTCAITDAVGTVSSPAAALVSAPTIGTEPVATSANAGGNASFSVSASGGTLTYQWYLNGTALSNGTQTDGTVVSGATSASLTLTGVHGADAGSYTVVVTDTGGPTTSTAATLTVNEPPAFTVQPVSVGLAAGQTASFYAPATGAGTVTYQWYLSSTAITNATDAYLLVTPVSSANAGSYTCIATNAAGSTTSTAATLTLSASTDLGRLTNVSVRTNCGTGSANIIAGFVLGGAGNNGSSKSMLIRADGPELANFGVPNFLPDPSLEVFNTTDSPAESVGQNTGWCVPTSNEAPVVAAENAVYAFALTTNSASSAIVLDLPPDQYTENVTGASGDTGIALAEIYDVTNATETYSAALPRLINVSARANVAASGAGNLIAGFTIGGSTDKTVLVRGTGPGLAEFSLTGLLAQPTLAVYSTESIATLVATNTGWDFDPVLASTAAGLYAFGQTSSADCCLLVTLPPGTYTANLDSNNAASGLALVEVYEVP